MKAVAVFPGEKKLDLVDHPEPEVTESDHVRIRMLDVGICGTDREIATYQYGFPPPGYNYLVLGHESLGEVTDVAKNVTQVKPGDLVIPTVRRTCEEMCEACIAGRLDFCYTGHYRERGIVRLHGFLTEHVVERAVHLNVVPQDLREVAVLAEPLTVTEKAFDQIEDIQRRLRWTTEDGKAFQEAAPRKALVLGAGPVGLLAAMKFRAQGFAVWVYSRGSEKAKPPLAAEIGAQFLDSETTRPKDLREVCGGQIDIVYEAMGAPPLCFEVLGQIGNNSVFVFTGIPRHTTPIALDTSALLYNLVLRNQLILGTVNAAPSHFRTAIDDLQLFRNMFPGTLEKLITRRYQIEQFQELLSTNSGIKNVISL